MSLKHFGHVHSFGARRKAGLQHLPCAKQLHLTHRIVTFTMSLISLHITHVVSFFFFSVFSSVKLLVLTFLSSLLFSLSAASSKSFLNFIVFFLSLSNASCVCSKALCNCSNLSLTRTTCSFLSCSSSSSLTFSLTFSP